MRTSWLTLPASRFASLLQSPPQTIAEATYTDPDMPHLSSFLFKLSGPRRHDVLSRLVRDLDESVHPLADFSTVVKHEEATDWYRDGQRVGLRSASLTWHSVAPRKVDKCSDDTPGIVGTGRWLARFTRVPPPRANVVDEVYLALYDPEGIHVYRHDGVFGLTSSGRLTPIAGQQIQVYSGMGVRGWRAALELYILPKFKASGLDRLGYLAFDDPAVIAAVAEQKAQDVSACDDDIYADTPLGDRGGTARARTLQALVLAIDQELHPKAVFSKSVTVPLGGESSQTSWKRDGSWRRDGVDVQCRTGRLTWQKKGGWLVEFHGIRLQQQQQQQQEQQQQQQLARGDGEVLLGLYTPLGLYVYRHDQLTGISSSGKLRSIVKGVAVKLYGPTNEPDWRRALEGTILPRLDESGCERLAFVDWKNGVQR